MLLMVEKCIRWGICHPIYPYAKANNKYMKDYDRNKELTYVQHKNRFIKNIHTYIYTYIQKYIYIF